VVRFVPVPALLLALVLVSQGPPLFYWGARPPVVVRDDGAGGDLARVLEVHAARHGANLVVRLTFDRPVQQALATAEGAPVSGRLQAVLYIDADDDRATGFSAGPRDFRTGAERRLEVGTQYLGEDPPERSAPSVAVRLTLSSVAADGSRRTLWRRDNTEEGRLIRLSGEWLEARVPLDRIGLETTARLILVDGDQAWDGRIGPEAPESGGRQ
jgi:hypothetical protein